MLTRIEVDKLLARQFLIHKNRQRCQLTERRYATDLAAHLLQTRLGLGEGDFLGADSRGRFFPVHLLVTGQHQHHHLFLFGQQHQ